MPRIQFLIFLALLFTTLSFILINENADLVLSKSLAQVILFPLRLVSNYLQYLQQSKERIEELEMTITRLKILNEELATRFHPGEETLSLSGLKLIKAIVIGRDPANFNGFLYINKGEKDGVYVNQPVIIANMLVGRVKSVASNTSLVETFEKNGFAISGFDKQSGVYGIVKNNGNLKLNYIKIDDTINIGDTIVTSGLSEIYPKGIVIGTIKEINTAKDLLFKEVVIQPFIKINRVFYVYLIYPKGEPAIQEGEEFRIPASLKNIQMKIPVASPREGVSP